MNATIAPARVISDEHTKVAAGNQSQGGFAGWEQAVRNEQGPSCEDDDGEVVGLMDVLKLCSATTRIKLWIGHWQGHD